MSKFILADCNQCDVRIHVVEALNITHAAIKFWDKLVVKSGIAEDYFHDLSMPFDLEEEFRPTFEDTAEEILEKIKEVCGYETYFSDIEECS